MFKLYGRVKNNKFIPFPGQGDESIYGVNITTKKLSIPPDFPADELNNTSILVNIDYQLTTVVNVIQVLATDFVETSALDEIKDQNEIVSQNFKNNLTTNHDYPAIPKDIFINKNQWEFLISSIQLNHYPLLLGPKGTGKTTIAYNIAETLGYKFYKVDCGTLFKPKSALVGQTQAKEGTTYLVQSQFLKHFSGDEKVVIFLDEISRIPPQAANYIMTILDANHPYIYIEEEATIIPKGKDVIFIAAGNFGPEYVDTRALDGALEDRLIKFYLNFLPPEKEFALVKSKLEKLFEEGQSLLLDDSIYRIIKIANQIREGVAENELTTTISTRKVIQMCSYLLKGFTAKQITSVIMKNLFEHDDNEKEYFDKLLDAIV